MKLEKIMLIVTLLRQMYLIFIGASISAVYRSIFYENYTADIYMLANISIAMMCLLLSVKGYTGLKTRGYLALREMLYKEDNE